MKVKMRFNLPELRDIEAAINGEKNEYSVVCVSGGKFFEVTCSNYYYDSHYQVRRETDGLALVGYYQTENSAAVAHLS